MQSSTPLRMRSTSRWVKALCCSAARSGMNVDAPLPAARVYRRRPPLSCAIGAGLVFRAPRAYLLAPLIFSQDRPAIARRIDELLRRVIDRGHAFENLLIGGIGRRRRAAPGIDQPLDRRAVEHFERPERAAARAPQIKRRRVDHQEVFQEHPKPSRPSMKLIRPREEARERGDARRVGGLHPKRWAL